MQNKKFITMGEILLRLTPPNYEKIRMATSFDVTYGGSEANIALALASPGVDSTFFSVVPGNSLGKSAIRALRSGDVHCSPVIFSTPSTSSRTMFSRSLWKDIPTSSASHGTCAMPIRDRKTA